MKFIFDQITNKIWLPRYQQVIQKEKSLNITQKCKVKIKNKGKNFIRRSHHIPNYLLNKPTNNHILTNTNNLIQVSIHSGQHFTLYLDEL